MLNKNIIKKSLGLLSFSLVLSSSLTTNLSAANVKLESNHNYLVTETRPNKIVLADLETNKVINECKTDESFSPGGIVLSPDYKVAYILGGYGEAEIESINLVIDWCKKLSNILNDMKQIRLREVLTAADVALVIAQMAKLAEYVDEGKRHAYLSDARKLIELYSGREKGAALWHEVDAQAEYVNHLTSAAEDAIMKDGGLEREREVDKLDKEGRKEVHDYIDLAGCKRMLGDVGYGCEYEDIVKVLESRADEKIKFIKHPDAELYTDRYLVGLGSIS